VSLSLSLFLLHRSQRLLVILIVPGPLPSPDRVAGAAPQAAARA
jgi:hypothetical protein